MTARVQVAVAGPSDASDDVLALAAAAGALLGEAGAVVVVGSADGVSGAAAAAALARGACVVHLVPQADRSAALPGATVAVPTGLGETCNALVVRAADALLAVGGGWGTLSEVALALRSDVPVVSLAGWRVLDDHGAVLDAGARAGTPADAVRDVLAAARARAGVMLEDSGEGGSGRVGTC